MSVDSHTLRLTVACLVVGGLAAFGMFGSIANFPPVFALVCLVLGVWSLWRDETRRAITLRTAVLLVGVAGAIGGWLYHQRAVERSMIEARERAVVTMRGRTVPKLAGLDPLNTERASWDAAASLEATATVITFWARWCTPCEKEMPELEALYREHRGRGLQVLAVTMYHTPDDPEERRSDFAKARRFLERRDLTYPAAITGDGQVFAAYQATSIPRTVLVDAEARVVDYAIGLDSARELMRRAVTLLDDSG